MGSWIHLAKAKHPDRVAIEGQRRTITYRELSEQAAAGSRVLTGATAARGRTAGDGARIALELDDRFDFALALHACLLAGVPIVPIDPRLSEEERAARRARASAVLSGWPAPGQEGGASVGRRPGGMPQHSGAINAAVVAVMHTSGTTAAPKPVELTYGNWLASALGSAVALGLDPDERWLCVMPLAHVGGLSILIRSAIYATTVVLPERFETGAVLDELMNPARRITMVSLVPTMLARLLDAGLERPPTLRWALLGGGPIAPGLLARARAARVPVAPTYGMTEACSQIATLGLPLHGVELRISDGEIIVRGPIVAPGALDADGWLHTGDLGRFEDDRLVIVGRSSDTIVTGGENVAPAEVEAILLEHPAVADAAVFPRPDPEWGEAVVARVVLRDGLSAAADELQRFCAGRLARFKVPKEIGFTAALPRTPSGKLIRRELG